MSARGIFWAFVWSAPMWAFLFLGAFALERAL